MLQCNVPRDFSPRERTVSIIIMLLFYTESVVFSHSPYVVQAVIF